jgi:hypothetical protein
MAASEAFAAYRALSNRDLSNSKEMALFDIQKDGNNYSIAFAKPEADKASDPATGVQRFTLQAAEIEALTSGTALPADHAIVPFINQLKNAAIVEYSNPFMAADNDNEFRVSADSFAFGLQRRNTSSPHWRGWLKPETRCLAPASCFAEYAPEPNPETKKDVVWFALDESGPLFCFAGIWTVFNGDREVEATPRSSPRLRFPHHVAECGRRTDPLPFARLAASPACICVGGGNIELGKPGAPCGTKLVVQAVLWR